MEPQPRPRGFVRRIASFLKGLAADCRKAKDFLLEKVPTLLTRGFDNLRNYIPQSLLGIGANIAHKCHPMLCTTVIRLFKTLDPRPAVARIIHTQVSAVRNYFDPSIPGPRKFPEVFRFMLLGLAAQRTQVLMAMAASNIGISLTGVFLVAVYLHRKFNISRLPWYGQGGLLGSFLYYETNLLRYLIIENVWFPYLSLFCIGVMMSNSPNGRQFLEFLGMYYYLRYFDLAFWRTAPRNEEDRHLSAKSAENKEKPSTAIPTATITSTASSTISTLVRKLTNGLSRSTSKSAAKEASTPNPSPVSGSTAQIEDELKEATQVEDPVDTPDVDSEVTNETQIDDAVPGSVGTEAPSEAHEEALTFEPQPWTLLSENNWECDAPDTWVNDDEWIPQPESNSPALTPDTLQAHDESMLKDYFKTFGAYIRRNALFKIFRGLVHDKNLSTDPGSQVSAPARGSWCSIGYNDYGRQILMIVANLLKGRDIVPKHAIPDDVNAPNFPAPWRKQYMDLLAQLEGVDGEDLLDHALRKNLAIAAAQSCREKLTTEDEQGSLNKYCQEYFAAPPCWNDRPDLRTEIHQADNPTRIYTTERLFAGMGMDGTFHPQGDLKFYYWYEEHCVHDYQVDEFYFADDDLGRQALRALEEYQNEWESDEPSKRLDSVPEWVLPRLHDPQTEHTIDDSEENSEAESDTADHPPSAAVAPNSNARSGSIYEDAHEDSSAGDSVSARSQQNLIRTGLFDHRNQDVSDVDLYLGKLGPLSLAGVGSFRSAAEIDARRDMHFICKKYTITPKFEIPWDISDPKFPKAHGEAYTYLFAQTQNFDSYENFYFASLEMCEEIARNQNTNGRFMTDDDEICLNINSQDWSWLKPEEEICYGAKPEFMTHIPHEDDPRYITTELQLLVSCLYYPQENNQYRYEITQEWQQAKVHVYNQEGYYFSNDALGHEALLELMEYQDEWAPDAPSRRLNEIPEWTRPHLQDAKADQRLKESKYELQFERLNKAGYEEEAQQIKNILLKIYARDTDRSDFPDEIYRQMLSMSGETEEQLEERVARESMGPDGIEYVRIREDRARRLGLGQLRLAATRLRPLFDRQRVASRTPVFS